MAELAAFVAQYSSQIKLATTAIAAVGQYQQGQAASQQAALVAAQRDRAANTAQIEAQQVAARERRKTRLVRSRAMAVAGASGAGVSDKTVNDIVTGIDTEGEMSALNALWSGNETAKRYREGAAMARDEASASRRAGNIGALSTAVSGSLEFVNENPTFFQKYGGKKASQVIGGSY